MCGFSIEVRRSTTAEQRAYFAPICGQRQGSHRNPAERFRWEKEKLRNERVFALSGGNEGYEASDDVKQDKEKMS